VAKISDIGIRFIKNEEGLRTKAYRDVVGVLTIGYGHTGPDVYEGMVLSEDECEVLLRRDVDRFEQGVTGALTREAKQWEFDAMVSLAFNVGLGSFNPPRGFRGSTVRRMHNAGDRKRAAAAFILWCKAGGKILMPLVYRRAREIVLFMGGYQS
jgi:lysozyme